LWPEIVHSWTYGLTNERIYISPEWSADHSLRLTEPKELPPLEPIKYSSTTLTEMRNRIAVWGRDAQENRVLITIELQVSDNIVRIQTYPEKVVSDDVFKAFMDQWRKNQEVELPEPDRVIARELSVSEGLLPDDLKAEQTDMILRAQTEWHFHVLSDKLAQSYKSELAEIEDRIERATEYSSELWNQAKNFWQKVQGQLQDKTLLRDQGNDIRKRVDKSFERLKAMRDELNAKYKEESVKHVAKFGELLEDAEKRINEGTHLNKVFNDLRDIQKKFHNVKFTREDRDAIYSRIDAAFKAVKAKRGQGGGNDRNAGRTQSRLDGLLKAMDRMRSGIGRDENDLKFERRRIEKTDGQLEKQIREAKVVMIESRVASKQLKLDDMIKTKAMLEKKIEQEKARAEKNAKKAAERAAADAAKAKIAADMANRVVSAEEKAKLEAAAAAISEGKEKKKKGGRTKPEDRTPENVKSMVALSEITSGEAAAEDASLAEKAGDAIATAITSVGAAAEKVTTEGGILDQIGDVVSAATDSISETLEDVTDTVKAVAQVASEKLDNAADKVEDVVEDAVEADKAKPGGGILDQIGDVVSAAKDSLSETIENVSEKAKAVADAAADKIDNAADKVEDVVEDAVEADKAKAGGGILDQIGDVVSAAKDSLSETIEDVTEKAKAAAKVAAEKLDQAADKVEDVVEDAVDSAKEEISGEEE
jgi:methyl-accepting chemotaxis protein